MEQTECGYPEAVLTTSQQNDAVTNENFFLFFSSAICEQ